MKAQTPESAAARIASAPAHYGSLIQAKSKRFAVIRGARTVKEALAYLPSNYDLMESFEVERQDGKPKPELIVIIGGFDNAGWTLDGYVIPRLASGLMFAEEILGPMTLAKAVNVAEGLRELIDHPEEYSDDQRLALDVLIANARPEIEYDTNDSSDLDPPEDA